MCKTTSLPKENDTVASYPYQPAPSKEPGSHWSKSNAGLHTHPVAMDDFYAKNPAFIWGPLLVAATLYTTTNFIQAVADYLARNDMEYFGFWNALNYTAFAILSSYAFHGFCTTHAPRSLKIQANTDYQVKPDAMAIRSTAALLTEMVYTFLPLAPSTYTWYKFAMWLAALNIYWDAHFYLFHRICHENKLAYRFFHKTHHLCKEPNAFGAYFVEYQSHILLEQVVVVLMAMLRLPRNVFMFSLYWGTIGTYVEHSGFELGSMKLPFVPMTFGQLCQVMSASTSWLLDGKL
jgi:hypothetical protein